MFTSVKMPFGYRLVGISPGGGEDASSRKGYAPGPFLLAAGGGGGGGGGDGCFFLGGGGACLRAGMYQFLFPGMPFLCVCLQLQRCMTWMVCCHGWRFALSCWLARMCILQRR